MSERELRRLFDLLRKLGDGADESDADLHRALNTVAMEVAVRMRPPKGEQ